MVLDTKKVMTQVSLMRQDVKDKKYIIKDEYEEAYPYLFKEAPTLFKMVYEDKIEYMGMLELLVNNAEKIKDNDISQYDADVIVGKKLADKYVYPAINKK